MGLCYEDILLWGQNSDPIPEQDWDLVLVENLTICELYELVIDPSITKCSRGFFLGCLHVQVGDAVRTKDREVIKFINNFRYIPSPENEILARWLDRSKALIENPEDYDYSYWGHNPSRFAKEGGL